MNFSLFIASPAVRALGFALVHSIWQAALIAVVAAIFFKKTGSADGRYRLGLGALLAVFASALATFFYYFDKGNGPAPGAGGLKIWQINDSPLAVGPGGVLPFSEPSFFEKTAHWFEANHAFIVGTWLIGAVFFLVKLLGGYWFARRLKTRQVRPVLADHAEILADLLKKLPNPRPVKLLESAIAAVPMTIGWLRPVILLPIGLVNHLTVEEVEFVLAHELAHIARRDWLFNLAQAFIEAIFYFNPAVWWLSSRIREERENVADDIALRVTGGLPVSYAKTLVRVQEAAIGQFQPALALAFSSPKRPKLMGRIQRLIFQQPQSNSATMEKMIATGLIIALAAALSLRANSARPVVKKLAELASAPIQFFQNAVADRPESRDSIPPKPPVKVRGDGFFTARDGDKTVKITYKDGKVTTLNINGEEVPKAEFQKYDALIQESLASLPAPPAMPDLPPISPISPMPPLSPMPPFSPLSPLPPLPPFGLGSNWSFDEHGWKSSKPDEIWMSGSLVLDDLGEFSTTDKEGRLHIFLNGKGGKNELVIDGQRAVLNGKPIENGQKISILKKIDGNDFVAMTGGGLCFQLKNGEFLWNPQDGAIQKQLAEQAARAEADQRLALAQEGQQMEAERREMARQREIDSRIDRHDSRAAEKEARAAEREARAEAQNEKHFAELDEETARADARTAELDAVTALADKRTAELDAMTARADGNSFTAGFVQSWAGESPATFSYSNNGNGWLRELLAYDGFDQRKFSVKLSDKGLKINGKKQSAEKHRKYLDQYYRFGGGRPGSSFEISVSERE